MLLPAFHVITIWRTRGLVHPSINNVGRVHQPNKALAFAFATASESEFLLSSGGKLSLGSKALFGLGGGGFFEMELVERPLEAKMLKYPGQPKKQQNQEPPPPTLNSCKWRHS